MGCNKTMIFWQPNVFKIFFCHGHLSVKQQNPLYNILMVFLITVPWMTNCTIVFDLAHPLLEYQPKHTPLSLSHTHTRARTHAHTHTHTHTHTHQAPQHTTTKAPPNPWIHRYKTSTKPQQTLNKTSTKRYKTSTSPNTSLQNPLQNHTQPLQNLYKTSTKPPEHTTTKPLQNPPTHHYKTSTKPPAHHYKTSTKLPPPQNLYKTPKTLQNKGFGGFCRGFLCVAQKTSTKPSEPLIL